MNILQFPKIKNLMEDTIGRCYECLLTNKHYRREPAKITDIREKPMESTCVDRRTIPRWPLQLGNRRQKDKISRQHENDRFQTHKSSARKCLLLMEHQEPHRVITERYTKYTVRYSVPFLLAEWRLVTFSLTHELSYIWSWEFHQKGEFTF